MSKARLIIESKSQNMLKAREKLCLESKSETVYGKQERIHLWKARGRLSIESKNETNYRKQERRARVRLCIESNRKITYSYIYIKQELDKK